MLWHDRATGLAQKFQQHSFSENINGFNKNPSIWPTKIHKSWRSTRIVASYLQILGLEIAAHSSYQWLNIEVLVTLKQAAETGSPQLHLKNHHVTPIVTYYLMHEQTGGFVAVTTLNELMDFLSRINASLKRNSANC